MPKGGGRGKKNYKGQRRHFTNEEELQQAALKEKKAKEWRRQRGEEDSEESDEENPKDTTAQERDEANARARGLPPSESESEDESTDDEDKHKGVSHLIDISNPNRQAGKQTKKVTELDSSGKVQLSRREREELAKQQAAANYRKMHLAGKTEEAQADMARLALIRKQREEAAKKRQEEAKVKESATSAAEAKLLEKKKASK